MKQPDLAIVGSGIVAANLAWQAVQRGLTVEMFEKGPYLRYPHSTAFKDEVQGGLGEPQPQAGLQDLTLSGDYRQNLNAERVFQTGGMASRWGAAVARLSPADFARWPFRYSDLEPFYCQAEELLGVSGDDEGNPYAAPRSRPYPQPPFAFTPDLVALNQRLLGTDLQLYTSPQARARLGYDGRPGCQNVRSCRTCPIGARYSPNHHLDKAVRSGLCTLHTDASVRRIVRDSSGCVRGLVWRDRGQDREMTARAVVLAAGAVESTRLMLLSGLNNAHLGRHFTLHHVWPVHIHYEEAQWAGQMGADGGQTRRFLERKDGHGGILIQMRSETATYASSHQLNGARTRQEVLNALRNLVYCQVIHLHAESDTSPGKVLTLSSKRDRFGDPFAHIDYRLSEFDRRTFDFACDLYQRYARATGGKRAQDLDPCDFVSAYHHLGGARMARQASDGVVDPCGRVFGSPGLYALGGAVFPDTFGVHPTLTMVAHTLFAAPAIWEDLR